MKKKIIVAYSAIALVILSYACTRFPAFPVELRAFFPYSENEKISFRNENDSIVTFNIKEIVFSEKYTTVGRVKCCENETNMHFSSKNIHIVEDNELSYVSGYMYALPTELNVSLSISGWGTSMDYTKDFSGYPYEENFTEIIGDTIRLSNDYGEAIFVKNKGLVQFAGFRSTWFLME